jgi:outer membrane protein
MPLRAPGGNLAGMRRGRAASTKTRNLLTMKTNKALLAGLAAASLLSSTAAFAQSVASGESPWMFRVRATYLNTDTSSEAGALPADAIDVNNKWIPEFDVSYFFTKNLAAELVLTVPQKHHVSVAGDDIGTFKHLPPTLLAQWHFTDLGAFKPYVGAGVNYTRLSSEKMSVGGTPATLESKSFGPALQVGVDYRLNRNWYLNADMKKVWISSDVFLGGSKISKVDVNPWLVSVGVGYRF